MVCRYCGGDMSGSINTLTATHENTIVVVKNVPCHKCKQCGDVVYSGSVVKRLEQIEDMFEKLLVELAVVDYLNV